MHEVALFYRPTCPYCLKVLRFMEKNKMSFPLKDVSASREVRETLQAMGGKTQVPCLIVDGDALYESNDIIQWFGSQM